MFLTSDVSQLVHGVNASNKEIWILMKHMIGCIRMIQSMQTTLMINLYSISYQVIKLVITNMGIVDGYLVCSGCFATILTQTQLRRCMRLSSTLY
jgi:hypothetical protein